MSDTLETALTGPAVWGGPETNEDLNWIEPLNDNEIAKTIAAIVGIKTIDKTLFQFVRGAFPPPILGPRGGAHIPESASFWSDSPKELEGKSLTMQGK